MKKNTGTIIAILALVVAFGGLVAWSISQKKNDQINVNEYDRKSDEYKGNAKPDNKVTSDTDYNYFIEASDDNGNIADHVKGDIEKAKVIIFEYADYQCPGCAQTNPRVNKLVDEYDGKVAIIYRSFLLSYHKNGTAAASAAEAAGLQGYWKEYANKLFANQSEWEYMEADKRTEIFSGYLSEVSDGKADTEKFKNDLGSDQVKKKIAFDMALAKSAKVDGTPTFYLNGDKIDFSQAGTEEKFLKLFREKIDAELNSQIKDK